VHVAGGDQADPFGSVDAVAAEELVVAAARFGLRGR